MVGGWEANAVLEDEIKPLVDAISAERFQPFLTDCDGDAATALRLYAWDGEVSRAFLGPLRDLEVTLRNALHARMAGRYGRPDWWNSPRARLNNKGTAQVRDARTALEKELGQRISADDMVAKLPLGFWVGLLGRGDNYEMRFWYPALRHAFPGYDGNRGALQKQLDYVRRFRNRIGHHERVCHRHLQADYRTVLTLTRYLSPQVADRQERFSQVPEVLARRRKVLSGQLPPRL